MNLSCSDFQSSFLLYPFCCTKGICAAQIDESAVFFNYSLTSSAVINIFLNNLNCWNKCDLEERRKSLCSLTFSGKCIHLHFHCYIKTLDLKEIFILWLYSSLQITGFFSHTMALGSAPLTEMSIMTHPEGKGCPTWRLTVSPSSVSCKTGRLLWPELVRNVLWCRWIKKNSSHMMNSREFSKTRLDRGRCSDSIFAKQAMDTFTKKAWVRLQQSLH